MHKLYLVMHKFNFIFINVVIMYVHICIYVSGPRLYLLLTIEARHSSVLVNNDITIDITTSQPSIATAILSPGAGNLRCTI